MAEATVTRVIEVDVRASAQAQAHIAQIAASMKNVEQVASDAKSQMQQFADNAVSAGKAFIAAFAVDKLLAFGKALNDINDSQRQIIARMTQVTGSTEGAGKAFSEIVRIAREQGRELDGVAKLYEKIARQQDQLGLTTRGISLITEGFASSLRLSGAGTQEASAAMLQFSQALASGKLAGDEFRSMTENNSVFMQELGKATGKTMGELKQMSKEGKIDLEFLREAMLKTGEDGMNMMERMGLKAAELPKTFAMAFNGVKAALADYLNALGSTAANSEGIMARLTNWVANNLTKSAAEERVRNIFEIERKRALGLDVTAEEKKVNQTPVENVLDQVGERRKKAWETIRVKELELQDLIAKGMDKMVTPLGRTLDMTAAVRKQIKEAEADLTASTKSVQAYVTSEKPYTVAGYTPPPKPPEKAKKERSHTEELDSFERANDAMLKALDDRAMKEDGIGKFERAILESLVQSHKYTEDSIQVQAARARARLEDQSDALEKFSANAIKASEKRLAQVEKEKRANEAFSDMLDKIMGRNNPVEKADRAIANLRKERDDLPGGGTVEQWAAADEAIHKIRENMAREIMGVAKEVKSVAEQMAANWEGTFERMTDNILTFSKSGKEILSDFVKDFLTQWAKLEMKQAMAPAMSGMSGFIRSLVGGISGGGTGVDSSIFAGADGAAFGRGMVRMMATGGLLNSPTYLGQSPDGTHNVGGEAGPEAVLPLQRGADGKLGVAQTPVTVNVVNNASGAKASAQESTDSRGNREIVVLVEDLVENGITTGRYDKALSHSFGVGRRGR